MTYIESALGDFIKSILTRGIRTLLSKRFIPYTIFLLLVTITSTMTAFVRQLFPQIEVPSEFIKILLFLELSTALAFITVGILMGRARPSIQIVGIISFMIIYLSVFYMGLVPNSDRVSLIISGSLYIFWVGIVTFSTFSLFRDLFANDIFGTILFLGEPEDHGKILFSLVGWILVFINFGLGYSIYKKATSGPLYYTAISIMLLSFIAMLPLLGFQSKNDVFYTIITWFFMFATIKIALLAFKTMTQSQGETSFWETLFSLFMAIYAVQGSASKGVNIGKKAAIDGDGKSLEDELMENEKSFFLTNMIIKFLTDKGVILIILGVLMGYHTTQVQTILGQGNIFQDIVLTSGADIVLLGYEVNIIITLVIYVSSLILFWIFPPFRRYANPEIRRIPWAPEYTDLKIMIAGIKEGDIEWKGDAAKLAIGIVSDKVLHKLGIKDTSEKTEDRIRSTFGKWMGRTKK